MDEEPLCGNATGNSNFIFIFFLTFGHSGIDRQQHSRSLIRYEYSFVTHFALTDTLDDIDPKTYFLTCARINLYHNTMNRRIIWHDKININDLHPYTSHSWHPYDIYVSHGVILVIKILRMCFLTFSDIVSTERSLVSFATNHSSAIIETYHWSIITPVDQINSPGIASQSLVI